MGLRFGLPRKGVIDVEGYNNGIVRVDQCGSTFYTVCFSPAICNVSQASEHYAEVMDVCSQEVQASHGAVIFDFKHLDYGVLPVLYNPQIQTADYQIEDSLKSIADVIAKSRMY